MVHGLGFFALVPKNQYLVKFFRKLNLLVSSGSMLLLILEVELKAEKHENVYTKLQGSYRILEFYTNTLLSGYCVRKVGKSARIRNKYAV